jgi:hypothetical protein
MNIYIYGSGRSDTVENGIGSNKIWINNAHHRSNFSEDIIWGMVISEGLLLTKEQLRDRKAIDALGLDANASLEFRLYKQAGVSNLKIKNLFCISNLDRKVVTKRMKEINNQYERLVVIPDFQISLYMRKLFKYEYRSLLQYKNVPFHQKMKMKLAEMFRVNIRFPASIRPSTGVSILLWLMNEYANHEVKFIVSGITGIFSKEAVHNIDREIISMLKEQPKFAFDEPNNNIESVDKLMLNKFQNSALGSTTGK